MAKKHVEEHEGGAERYLLTYADLITLLLGLFIILYSMGQTEMAKFRSYSAAFNLVFGGGGGKGMPIGMDPMLVGQHPKPGYRTGATGGGSGGEGEKGKELKEIQGVQEGAKGEEKFQVRETGEGIIISLPEKLSFGSGYAELKGEARAVLDSLCLVFKKYDNEVRIEGHTDDMPISTRFPNNMALSNARASNAYTYLVESRGMDPRRISTSGYGEYRPVAPNDTPENRAKNRRIDIVVITGKAPEPEGQGPGH